MSGLNLWLYRLGQWLALGLAVVVLALLLIGVNRFYTQLDRPFSHVVVDGPLDYLEREQLSAEIEQRVSGGFLSVDLISLAEDLEMNPWIASAQVRRRWPAELVVEIVEERPVARWGDRGFLNDAGQPLKALVSEKLQQLPLLSGAQDSAPEMVASYQLLASLLQRSGQGVAELSRNSRGEWQLTTRSGIEIALGRSDLAEKMRRFNAIWTAQLKTLAGQVARVDLRYPNGAAVAWRQQEKQAALNTNTNQLIGRG